MKAFVAWSFVVVVLMYLVPYAIDAGGFIEYLLWCLLTGLYIATALLYMSRRWGELHG